MPTTKIDWRTWKTREICPRCAYWNECYSDVDCEAIKVLVKICEDLDCGNPDE